MSGRKGKVGKSPVPHDRLFKAFLTHTDTARDFLTLHLPTELLLLCDLPPYCWNQAPLLRKTCGPILPTCCTP